MNQLKRYPITILTVALIWYLSFFTPPSTKLDNVIGFDKVVHFGMYGFLCSVILWEQCRSSDKTANNRFNIKRFLCYFVFPILMSGLIEILQENCTGGRRSGDIFDFFANSLGVICASLIVPKLLSKFLKPQH